MGVKIVAPGLESAVAGTSLHVVGPDDDEEELKDAVMEDMAVRAFYFFVTQTHTRARAQTVCICCAVQFVLLALAGGHTAAACAELEAPVILS